MNESKHVIISGRVQGVGYRAWTISSARKLMLSGWVRNRSDGTVEALFHGAPAQIEQMLTACAKGPVLARVDKVDAHASDEVPEEKEFNGKPSL